MDLMEENGLARSSHKKEIRSLEYRRSPRHLKFSQPLASRYEKKKKLAPRKKCLCVCVCVCACVCVCVCVRVGVVYTMENTHYQKVVRVGKQKWKILENTIGFFFSYLRFLFTIFYTWSFQVQPEKNHPRKCQFPPKIPISLHTLSPLFQSLFFIRITPGILSL